LNNLKREAKKHRVLFIKLDPPIHVNDYKSQDYNENRYPETKIYLDNFASAGCIHQGFPLKIEDSIQPRFQSVVTDSINYEKNLPRHTRNFIKTAKKVNMQIESGTYEFLDDFARLVSLTEERKGISLRSKEYFKRLLDIYGEDARIFLAKVNIGKLMADLKEELEKLYAEKETLQPNQKKKTHLLLEKIDSVEKKVKMFEELKEQGVPQEECAIAGALSVKYGKTAEMLYAGMDEQFKQFMPQYLEYIENFRWAFDAGCTEFSMGGVEGTLDDGLTKFKDNFAPIINEYIGEFDLPVNKLLYKPSKIAYNKVKNRLH
jgi:serine/alanine adding enzyme